MLCFEYHVATDNLYHKKTREPDSSIAISITLEEATWQSLVASTYSGSALVVIR